MILEDKIVYVSVEKNYICLKLVDDRIFRIRKSLQQFQEELTPNRFVRIHKKYVVCISYIKYVDKDEVTMVSGDRLPIGREYNENFFNQFRVI